GEIEDEFDDAEIADVIPQPDGEFLVNAELSVSELSEVFGLLLVDDEDVYIVDGLYVKNLCKMTTRRSEEDIEHLTLTVESLAGRRNRVDTIRVTTQPAHQEFTPRCLPNTRNISVLGLSALLVGQTPENQP